MPLITTIAEFKQYIAIDDNTQMETMLPYTKEAEQLYIIDLLGKDFYEEFLAAYSLSLVAPPADPLSAEQAALLPYVQRCLAYYTQLLAQLHLSVSFGELGVRQARGDDSDPAPRWMQEKLQFQSLRNGDIHADKLLAFLEENATNSNDYLTWFNNANTKNSGYIVYSTSVASNHIDINNSRRVFLKLRPKMREIERRMVPKLISQEQYDALVTAMQAGNVSAEQSALMTMIEPIVCKRALYMQLPFMRVQVNENGIFVYSGTDELHKNHQLAGDAEIKVLRQQLMDGEFGYIADEEALRFFIKDNIADYPLIAGTTAYTTQPDPGPTWKPTNDPDNKHFAV